MVSVGYVVGQKNLLKQIDWMCDAKCFPRFSILVGENGDQEKQIAFHVVDKLMTLVYELPDNKIDNVRDMIEQSYKIHNSCVYIIPSGDDMSVAAKNALLKVTEEPPNNAYFIMMLNDPNNTLDTIRSRATIFTMEPYSKKDLLDYVVRAYDENSEIYLDLGNTPSEIDMLYHMGAEDFYEYVKKVVENIAVASGANSFKIADKVAIKDENGYDLKMFWKACIKLFFEHLNDRRYDDKENAYYPYLKAAQVTSDAIKKLSIKGVNKQMLFDEWIIAVRGALR